MRKRADRPPFFERLQTGLQEGIRFARGELALRTTVLPAPPPALRARDVLALRQRLQMSQCLFARTLNVSTKTVQSWEQGLRKPSQAALRLLQVFGEKPELLREVVGLTAAVAKEDNGELLK